MPRRKVVPAAPTVAAQTEKPSVAIVTPIGPSPAVLELQGDIVGLVRERSGYRKLVADAQAELYAAQAKFQATQGRLTQYEQEIQERISLIAQLENRAPVANYPSHQETNLVRFGNTVGVSVDPSRPPQTGYQSDPNDMVNRAHIDRTQAQAMRAVL